MAARLASICLIAVFAACGVFGSGANPRVSDVDYIAIARSSVPAQAFYAKYAGVDAQVDRSGRLAVDFRAGGARLRVFIEKDHVTDAFVECSPGAIRTGDVIVAIRSCP